MKHLSAAAGLCLAASLPVSALADAHGDCPLSYEVYEISVPHTDLEECPPAMQIEGAFCRVSVVAEVATVYAFSEETDCIVASKSFYDDQFKLSFE